MKAAFVFCLIAAALAVDFLTFDDIKEANEQMVVNFLDSSVEGDKAHMDALEALESDPLFEGYRIAVVDKQNEANTDFFASAGFTADQLPLLFIVNEEEGVDRVPGTTVEDLKEAMQLKKMVGDADKVATLTTTEEIDAALAEEVPVVFKLFEQWCGHCKQLAPIYVKAATVIDNAKFVEIECSLNNDTQAFCDEREVKGFPTVATHYQGKFVEFNMARTVPGFKAFVDALIADPEAVIAQAEAQKAAMKAQEDAKAAEEAKKEHAIEIVADLEAENAEIKAENDELKAEIAELKEKVAELAKLSGVKQEL